MTGSTKRFIIGLNGVAGSGKDSVGDVLHDEYGFIKCSFSDALYDEVSRAFNIDKAKLYDRRLKEKDIPELALRKCKDPAFINRMEFYGNLLNDKANSPRRVLQLWGTQYRRNEDPDYWIKKAQEFLAKYPDSDVVNVSTRFPNEAKIIRDDGGVVVQVVRPGYQAINEHESDNYFIHPDFTLINDGTLDDLLGKVERLLDQIAAWKSVEMDGTNYDIG